MYPSVRYPSPPPPPPSLLMPGLWCRRSAQHNYLGGKLSQHARNFWAVNIICRSVRCRETYEFLGLEKRAVGKPSYVRQWLQSHGSFVVRTDCLPAVYNIPSYLYNLIGISQVFISYCKLLLSYWYISTLKKGYEVYLYSCLHSKLE